MVNRSLLRKKISQIEEHLRRIKQLPQLSYEEFLQNTVVQDVFLFNITQAIQKCVDIALHIVSDEGWGVPATQREAFEILCEKGILSEEWLELFTKMIGFRNRIIHEYESIRWELVYKIYEKGVEDIQNFCVLIMEKLGL